MKEQENKTAELNSLANRTENKPEIKKEEKKEVEKKERAKTFTLTVEQLEELAKDEKLRKCFINVVGEAINVAGNVIFQTAKMISKLL